MSVRCAAPQKLKEKRKQAAQGTVVWQHRAFTNPARRDGLQVCPHACQPATRVSGEQDANLSGCATCRHVQY